MNAVGIPSWHEHGVVGEEASEHKVPLRGDERRRVDWRDHDSSNIATLTGLRGVAALHVLAFHIYAYLLDHPCTAPILIENGPCAVTLFYVLSGFVLSTAATRELQPLSRSAFYVKRFARLAPLYWLGLLVCACNPSLVRLFWSGRDGINPSILYQPWQRLLALVLTPVAAQTWLPFTEIWFLWNAPSWSVSNEAFFYLLFPIVQPTAAQWASTARGTCCALLALVLAQALCAVAYVAPVLMVWKGLTPSRPTRSVELEVYAAPYVRVFHFLIGTVLGNRFQLQHTKSRPPIWAADVAVGACAWLLASHPVAVNGGHVPNNRAFQATAALSFWLQGLALGLAIYCVAFEQGGVACRLLASSPLQHLGKWSYAIYILHLPILAMVVYIGRGGGGDEPVYCVVGGRRPCDGEAGLGGSRVVVAIGLVLALSAAAHMAIEVPLQRRIRRWLISEPSNT